MSNSIDIKPPRLDNHDNGFSLILDRKWFDLGLSRDLSKLNEHNLRLMLRMNHAYEAKLAEFNKQFIDEYIGDFDLTNESPVGEDIYHTISLEVWTEHCDRK